jgi:hypothetical protein
MYNTAGAVPVWMTGVGDGMTREGELSCVEPVAGAAVRRRPSSAPAEGETSPEQEVIAVTARVGQEAPDFEARALAEGGFKNVKLSDYRGKWVLLCFYPGDFTFV